MKTYKVLLTLVVAFLFTACNDKSDENKYTPLAKKIDKKSYKLGIHPYLNSKKMYISYRPILDYIEMKLVDTDIVLETSSSYAEYNVKLYRGDFDFSLPNPFQTYNSLSKGYSVTARMKPDTVFRGIFVARKDSDLKSVDQLKGKSVSFPAPTALAATMMPLYYLHENGIDVKKDINKKYVGSQYSSILNAYNSDTIAGATWPPPWELWKKENPKKADKMEVVWETDSLINNGLVFKNSMDKELVNKITNILVNLDKTPKGKKLLSDAGFEGFQFSNNKDYDTVSDFLKKYDKVIGIPK